MDLRTLLLIESLIAAMAYPRNDHFLILRFNGVETGCLQGQRWLGPPETTAANQRAGPKCRTLS